MTSLRELAGRVAGDELLCIDFAGSGDESRIVVSRTVSVPGSDFKRTVALSRGLLSGVNTSSSVHSKSIHDGLVKITGFTDWFTAVSQFLNFLERHGVPEEDAKEVLKASSYNLEEYWEFVDGVTTDGQKERLSSQLQDQESDDEMLSQYLRDGTFRTVRGFSPEEQEIITKMQSDSVQTPYVCYESAMTGIDSRFLDDERVTYVEGVALQKYPGNIVKHAWVEVNDAVVELTWPWHSPKPPEASVYYGIPMEPREAYETMQSRGRYCGVTIPDDLYDRVSPE